jgi:hypothetical protein
VRKLSILLVLLTGTLALAQVGPVPASASAYCSVTCPSGIVLQCCLSSGTCTSVTGTSIDCDGTPQTCEAADCARHCEDAYDNCLHSCFGTLSCRACEISYSSCTQRCGPDGRNNIGC